MLSLQLDASLPTAEKAAGVRVVDNGPAPLIPIVCFTMLVCPTVASLHENMFAYIIIILQSFSILYQLREPAMREARFYFVHGIAVALK